MPGNYLRLYVHLIWKTWDHLPFLVPDVRDLVYPMLLSKAREHNCEVLALGGVEDHVHLLISLSVNTSIATLIKELKGASSAQVNNKRKGEFFKWQGSYGAITVTPSAISDVTDYIEQQATHHQRHYMREELETCSVEYSPDN